MLTIEGGAMAPDPVHIRNRIPKLQELIQQEIQLFDGQVYIIESLQLQGFNSQIDLCAKQAFIHFISIFEALENLREGIEAINSDAGYYAQIYQGFKAGNPHAWLAFEKVKSDVIGQLRVSFGTMWKSKMAELGVDVTKLQGQSGKVAALEDVKPVAIPQAPVAAPVEKPKPKAIPEKEVQRVQRNVDSNDFKRPPMLTVTDEIRNHLPAQAYKQAEENKLEEQAEPEPLPEPQRVESKPVASTPNKAKLEAAKKRVALLEALAELDEETEDEPEPKPVKTAVKPIKKPMQKAALAKKVGVAEL